MLSFEDLKDRKEKIAVVGLGYVGLPLALLLSSHFDVIGFDIDEKKIAELQAGKDRTGEVNVANLRQANVLFTANAAELSNSRFIIVAVPTPVDKETTPDISILQAASSTVGKHLSKGSIVVFESTVYPGVTEDICAPIIAKESGFELNEDFFIGYSPERVNPGDSVHTIDKITKIVAGSSHESEQVIAEVYKTITNIFCAASIRVAEAAKVIENTQRDINIALMNELSMVFHKMDIDTKDVLAAAGTKWNFLPFTPGLVGGHCIGVDPYYLTYKAAECGHHAKTILVGREINDGMPKYIVSEIEDWSRNQGKNIDTLNVYGWGVTFKENVSDIRNAKIAEVYLLLQKKGVTLQVHDPHADAGDIQSEYGLPLQSELKDAQADILIVGVAHKDYTLLSEEAVASYVKQGGLIVDIKGLYNKEHFISKGYSYWRL